MRRAHPVWGLNLLLAVATVVVGGLLLRPAPSALADPNLPWWVLATLVLAAERWPIHLEFRRSAHSFSMTDIPLVLALVFSTPAQMLLGVAVGTGVAMALRGLSAIKFTFNVLQFAVCAEVAIVLLRLITGDADPDVGPLTWVGAIVGLQVSGSLGMALVCAAIVLSDGSISREQAGQMFGVDSIVTATNTSLALLLAIVVVDRPEAALILAVPVAVVYLAYRSFAAERQRREKLQFLYETNRTFLAAPALTDAIGSLLGRALDAFRAEQAEIVLFSAERGVAPVRVGATGGSTGSAMEPVAEPGAGALLDLVARNGGPFAFDIPPSSPSGVYLTARGTRAGIVAVLRGEERVVGFLLLANRSGIDQGFSPDDVALVETLAANASAALQYDRLEQTVEELRLLKDRLHHDAFHDGLTGLANRALFHETVEAALGEDAASEAAVLFLDLDNFKAVNDTFGHSLGDAVLTEAARRLCGALADTPGATVARLGGDEFAVLLPAPAASIEEHATRLAQTLLDAFAAPVETSGRSFDMSASIGVATSRHSGRRRPDLLRDADVAMYDAKASGRSRWRLFDPAMREAVLQRHGLRADLERAIATGRLAVHYQPIVDLRTGRAVAVEALVRWTHPERGRVPPLDFIHLAEENGLIIPLGRFVLADACRQAARWRTAGPDGTPIAVHVNLSARELEAPDVIDVVAAAIAESGISPDQLVLELTESVLVEDAARGATTLMGLRELGVSLSLDDFGTGFSSLSYLRTLPLDQLKIAREFVERMGGDAADDRFVRLMLELAQGIGLQVVAEGVETAAQHEALRALGCDRAQGYFFGPPRPAGALLASLPSVGVA